MKSFLTKQKKVLYTLLAAAFWLLVWQGLSMIYNMDFVLPSPIRTASVLVSKLIELDFWSAIAFSVGRIMLGFGMAAVFGIVLAVLGIRIKAIKVLFDPFCAVVRAVPVVSFIILVLVMFSAKNVSVVISFLMGFPVIYSTVSKGVDHTPIQLLEAADVFGIGFWRSLRYIYLPHLSSFMASGLSVACGLCFKSGVAAEVIGYPKGSVGEAMYQAKIGLDMPGMLSYTAVIVVISVLIEKLILYICTKRGRGEGAK